MFVIIEGRIERTPFLDLFDFAIDNNVKFTCTESLQAYFRENVPTREFATQTEYDESYGDQDETPESTNVNVEAPTPRIPADVWDLTTAEMSTSSVIESGMRSERGVHKESLVSTGGNVAPKVLPAPIPMDIVNSTTTDIDTTSEVGHVVASDEGSLEFVNPEIMNSAGAITADSEGTSSGDVIFDGFFKNTSKSVHRRRRGFAVALGQKSIAVPVQTLSESAAQFVENVVLDCQNNVHNTQDLSAETSEAVTFHQNDDWADATFGEAPIDFLIAQDPQELATTSEANLLDIDDVSSIPAYQSPVVNAQSVAAKTSESTIFCQKVTMADYTGEEHHMISDDVFLHRPTLERQHTGHIYENIEHAQMFSQEYSSHSITLDNAGLNSGTTPHAKKIGNRKRLSSEVSSTFDRATLFNIPMPTDLELKKQAEKRNFVTGCDQVQNPEFCDPETKKSRVCQKSNSSILNNPESSVKEKQLTASEALIPKIPGKASSTDFATQHVDIEPIQIRKPLPDSNIQQVVSKTSKSCRPLPADSEHIDVIYKKMKSLKIKSHKPLKCNLCSREIQLSESRSRSVLSLREHVFGHIRHHPKCSVCSNFHDPSSSARQLCFAEHPHLPLKDFMYQVDCCFERN